MTINVGGSNITFSDSTVQTTAFISPLAVNQGGLNLTTIPTNGQIPIGTGTGYTVKEIASAFYRVNKLNCDIEYLPRRIGDAERTVLDKPSTYMINSYTLDELVKV